MSIVRHVERLLALAARPGPFSGAAPGSWQEWAESEATHLPGRPYGPRLAAAGPGIAMRGALIALFVLASVVPLLGLELLGERAAVAGLTRQGRTLCQSCSRRAPALNGAVALTLSRSGDG